MKSWLAFRVELGGLEVKEMDQLMYHHVYGETGLKENERKSKGGGSQRINFDRWMEKGLKRLRGGLKMV